MAVRRSHTDMFEVTSPTTSSSDTISNRSRPKTAYVSSTTNLPFSVGQLQKNEVQSLLRSLDHDDTFIVQVDCLADYRKLVQSINLRQTPVDYKSLYALQQRENRIVQRNACRDTRFRSLIETLSPAHLLKLPEDNSNDVKHSHV
jgi:biopolymer transport protein ExbD